MARFYPLSVAEVRRETLTRMLSEFDDDERQELAELLERFVAALDDVAKFLQCRDAAALAERQP